MFISTATLNALLSTVILSTHSHAQRSYVAKRSRGTPCCCHCCCRRCGSSPPPRGGRLQVLHHVGPLQLIPVAGAGQGLEVLCRGVACRMRPQWQPSESSTHGQLGWHARCVPSGSRLRAAPTACCAHSFDTTRLLLLLPSIHHTPHPSPTPPCPLLLTPACGSSGACPPPR